MTDPSNSTDQSDLQLHGGFVQVVGGLYPGSGEVVLPSPWF